jgi:hypothetical protein
MTSGGAKHAIGVYSDVRPYFNSFEIDKYRRLVHANVVVEFLYSMACQIAFGEIAAA